MKAPYLETRTEIQALATKRMAATLALEILLYGGSRSGKTFLLVILIIKRAAKCKSRHGIARRTLSDARTKIGEGTLRDAFEALGMIEDIHYFHHAKDFKFTLENGSEIRLLGMDTRDGQYKKVLGDEYSTLYFNEADDIAYEAIEYGLSRVAQKNELNKRVFYDCNPPTKAHWIYKKFFKFEHPEDGTPLDSTDFMTMQMNPGDNIQNLDPKYIEKVLNKMSARKRKKFLEGEFGEIAYGKVFNNMDINANKVDPEDVPPLDVIVVSVDPNVSSRKGSDDCGIIAAGKRYGYDDIYILEDQTIPGAGPGVWPGRVAATFKRLGANYVLAESNQGGELVGMAIKAHNKHIPVFTVHSKVGKFARAEPVAEMYAQGIIHHVGTLQDLEDEQVEWDPENSTESPNRIDALVQVVTKLSEGGSSYDVADTEEIDRLNKEEAIKSRETIGLDYKEMTLAEMFSDDNIEMWN